GASPVVGRRAEEVGRPVGAAPAGDQPLVELDGPRLLEEVDDGVGVGAQGEHDPGLPHGGGGAHTVGEVALGGRAEADGGTGVAARTEWIAARTRSWLLSSMASTRAGQASESPSPKRSWAPSRGTPIPPAR